MHTARKWIGLILLVIPVIKYIQNWQEEDKKA
ncbi:hypothetical protein BW727_100939 [Jeotgalibaca dankookensis]|uniref:Uncharacterized protein n=1 Tax=Jeotgalibaca dankookensis TaxID=708126 RepID=A0A1S6IP51_9LACT|nr:hypothetical protein BW727_100939 [Jeotgalibaca dankookensis]